MFGSIKSFIPEPRQVEQPRGYVGRHRVAETDAETPATETGAMTTGEPPAEPATAGNVELRVA